MFLVLGITLRGQNLPRKSMLLCINFILCSTSSTTTTSSTESKLQESDYATIVPQFQRFMEIKESRKLGKRPPTVQELNECAVICNFFLRSLSSMDGELAIIFNVLY